jgi:hypothetical protein
VLTVASKLGVITRSCHRSAKTSCKPDMCVACARSKTVFANFAASSTLLASDCERRRLSVERCASRSTRSREMPLTLWRRRCPRSPAERRPRGETERRASPVHHGGRAQDAFCAVGGAGHIRTRVVWWKLVRRSRSRARSKGGCLPGTRCPSLIGPPLYHGSSEAVPAYMRGHSRARVSCKLAHQHVPVMPARDRACSR